MGYCDSVKTLGATDMGVCTLFWLFLRESHQILAGVIMENPEKGFLWLWLSQGNSNHCQSATQIHVLSLPYGIKALKHTVKSNRSVSLEHWGQHFAAGGEERGGRKNILPLRKGPEYMLDSGYSWRKSGNSGESHKAWVYLHDACLATGFMYVCMYICMYVCTHI